MPTQTGAPSLGGGGQRTAFFQPADRPSVHPPRLLEGLHRKAPAPSADPTLRTTDSLLSTALSSVEIRRPLAYHILTSPSARIWGAFFSSRSSLLPGWVGPRAPDRQRGFGRTPLPTSPLGLRKKIFQPRVVPTVRSQGRIKHHFYISYGNW